ncbi:UvrABC system protein C [Frankliniella fusca]|uniref:UvrABC system protein C n=1 Tax=Frankliniella fusca TaxID=407009 RepID=A0AAE1HXQ6_9NEOP|nr:UvrABC system protein C [Frankliniella fusca]
MPSESVLSKGERNAPLGTSGSILTAASIERWVFPKKLRIFFVFLLARKFCCVKMHSGWVLSQCDHNAAPGTFGINLNFVSTTTVVYFTATRKLCRLECLLGQIQAKAITTQHQF